MGFNLFKWFQSGPEAAEKVLDASIRGLDAIILTDEERLEYQRKLAEQWVQLQALLGEETTVRGVTRRILGVMFSGAYLVLSFASAGIYYFNQPYADFLWEIANGQLGWITLTVVAFYFGPHFIGQMLGKTKGTA